MLIFKWAISLNLLATFFYLIYCSYAARLNWMHFNSNEIKLMMMMIKIFLFSMIDLILPSISHTSRREKWNHPLGLSQDNLELSISLFQRNFDFKGKTKNSSLTSCDLHYLPHFPSLQEAFIFLFLCNQTSSSTIFFIFPTYRLLFIYCYSFPWVYNLHGLVLW